MTFSMKRVMTIMQKDYKDLSRNLYVSMTLFIPLIMAAIFGRLDSGTVDAQYMIINMAFIMVATYIQSSLIAEEKEKNTLRGLMLSPASTFEIFCGKSLLTFISTAVIVFLSSMLIDYHPKNMLIVTAALFLSAIFYLGVGTWIGLLTKSVMEASVAIVPAILIFTFGSLVIPFIEKYPILGIVEYMPNFQLIDLARQVEAGAGMVDVWPNMGIILVWAIAIHVLSVYVYKKSMMD
ncbi:MULTISPECIES: ABC transporter permease [Bacillales]|uniref:ABC transporter permease n=1 Tax=Bacillales TaxID=1385 RepID=UPI0006A79CBC|nr:MULTISPECIES: ABC transporter permease [Bacillales]OBZ11363.1 ABC transporter [Bacillus sp. FJAT-26390]